jgi:hypothetical protein
MTMREPLAVGESTARAVLMERSTDKAEVVAVGGPFRGESCEIKFLKIVIVKARSCTCEIVIVKPRVQWCSGFRPRSWGLQGEALSQALSFGVVFVYRAGA